MQAYRSINYGNFYLSVSQNKLNTAGAISRAACSVLNTQDINTLVTMTHSGSTARMISRHRPSAQIIAMTPIKKICSQLSIVWGVRPYLITEYNSSDEIPDIVNEVLKNENIMSLGEKYVITGGVPVGIPGTTNYLSVLKLT